MEPRTDKGHRGDAAQFFVAGELCRRELVAVITLGNCPNTDILVSNAGGTRFCHIQVKTFVPGNRTVSVGMKAEKDYGRNFYWVLAGIPLPDSGKDFEFFIVPASDMARAVSESFQLWASSPGAKGQQRNSVSNKVRTLCLPPKTEKNGWSLMPYRNKWEHIINAVAT